MCNQNKSVAYRKGNPIDDGSVVVTSLVSTSNIESETTQTVVEVSDGESNWITHPCSVCFLVIPTIWIGIWIISITIWGLSKKTRQREDALRQVRLNNLRERAKNGDLIAFQLWKEETGRMDMQYSFFMVWF